MTDYSEASMELLDLAKTVIDKWHPYLRNHQIGFCFRDDDHPSGIPGKASKTPAAMRPHLDTPFDYVVWISKPMWNNCSGARREAMIDHALTYAVWKPDIIEFSRVLEHYGAWRRELLDAKNDIDRHEKQLMLDLKPSGSVKSVTFSTKDRQVTLGETPEQA